MNQNDKNKLEKFGMTHNQISELKSFLVERIVDNMSTKDLVEYVTDDLDKYYENMPDYYSVSFDDQQLIVNDNLGVWEADDEDDLIEEITTASGWCIKSIDYEIQLK